MRRPTGINEMIDVNIIQLSMSRVRSFSVELIGLRKRRKRNRESKHGDLKERRRKKQKFFLMKSIL